MDRGTHPDHDHDTTTENGLEYPITAGGVHDIEYQIESPTSDQYASGRFTHVSRRPHTKREIRQNIVQHAHTQGDIGTKAGIFPDEIEFEISENREETMELFDPAVSHARDDRRADALDMTAEEYSDHVDELGYRPDYPTPTLRHKRDRDTATPEVGVSYAPDRDMEIFVLFAVGVGLLGTILMAMMAGNWTLAGAVTATFFVYMTLLGGQGN